MVERAQVEVVIIGGTAVQTRAYPTLCHVGKWFLDHQYETHFVDGAVMSEGNLTVLSPHQQADEVRRLVTDIDNPRKRLLYVTHCLGMAAAVELMVQDCGNSRLVALSPSLPTPYSTVRQPHFLKNIVEDEDRSYVPAYSWSDEPFKPTLNPSRIDALVPPDYFDGLEQMSEEFSRSVTRLEERERVKLVVPRNDWNQPSVADAHNYSNIMHVTTNHSLLDRTFSHAPDALYRRIVNFALD